MANHPPPPEFSTLGLFGEFISVRGGREWHGPCPFCYGKDRFIVHTDQPFPRWNWWCRVCGERGWADTLNPSLSEDVDPAKLEYLRQAAAERQAERDEYRRQVMAQFTAGEVWKELHERMTPDNYQWWESQGVPHMWADFWKLGYLPEKRFESNGEFFTRPVYTIPKFDLNWQATNMDYRIVNPPQGVGKYRPEYGLQATAFFSRPDLPALPDEIFIVEGSKKAAVLTVYQREKPMVIGLPSCNSWAGITDRIMECGRVWVIFDPDATHWGEKFARQVGAAARIVELPVKPDDAFVQYGMSQATWKNILKHARRI